MRSMFNETQISSIDILPSYIEKFTEFLHLFVEKHLQKIDKSALDVSGQNTRVEPD